MTEVDERAVSSTVTLQDCLSDIDLKVRGIVERARRSGADGPGVVDKVFDELGDVLLYKPWLSKVEDWIERSLPAASPGHPGKKYVTDVNKTKYKGVFNNQHALAPVILCNGVTMGADKVGHFFQLGYRYHAHRLAGGAAAARSMGQASERGVFGLGMTGVYSKADLSANEAGMRFYRDLESNPAAFSSLKRYIDSSWDERANPSLYRADIGLAVWRNIIEGEWRGNFDPGAVSSNVHFFATTETASDGKFDYNSDSGRIEGRLNCALSPNLTSGGNVEGVKIIYDWVSGQSSGKGYFESNKEDRLVGRWGYKSSSVDGGSWRLRKI